MESINAMKKGLARLEARLQALVEGGAARLFPFSAAPGDMAPHLLAALHGGVKIRADGRQIAPNLFILSVHPGREAALEAEPGLVESLSEAVQLEARQANLTFLQDPLIRIASDPEIPPQQIRILAKIELENLDQTSGLEVETDGSSSPAIPENAFLIVNGMNVFPLTQTVINIGRREDNQLVIDDPRVSRVHAQLRAIKGRFVVFDLDSTGGTFVNEKRTHQSILFPGDVISLAGISLVFGQDISTVGQTQKFDL